MTFKIHLHHFLAFATQVFMLLLFTPDVYTSSYKGATSHTTNNAANKTFLFQQLNVISEYLGTLLLPKTSCENPHNTKRLNI